MAMNKNNFKQYDTRWAKLGYPKSPYFIKQCGCGEVAIANCIIEMSAHKNQTPKTIQPYCKQYAAPNGNGTYFSGIPAMMKHYGMTDVMEHQTMQSLWNEMKKGYRCAILLMGNRKGGDKKTHWTSSAHFVAAVAYKSDGKKHYLYIKDSNSASSDRNGWLAYEDSLRGDVSRVWSGNLNVKKADPLQKWYDALKTQYEWMKNSAYGWVNPPTIANSKKKSTCIAEIACALQRLGLLPEGGWFYLNLKTGKINGKCADYVKQHKELFEVLYPNKTIAQLGSNIHKGDIVAYRGTRGHIMVYMGKDANGNPLFTTMGNKKNHPIGVSVKVPGYAKSKIAMIVRLKKTAR